MRSHYRLALPPRCYTPHRAWRRESVLSAIAETRQGPPHQRRPPGPMSSARGLPRRDLPHPGPDRLASWYGHAHTSMCRFLTRNQQACHPQETTYTAGTLISHLVYTEPWVRL